MWMIYNPTIIAKPEFELSVELSQVIRWLEWFDFELVQSTPRMLIYPCFCLLAKWLSLLKVVCWLKWMRWIPLCWVLAMLVVQSSCFAISFPPCIFHSNCLSMSLCLCWIRSTCQIRLLGLYSFFVRSIFMWWCTRYIAYGQIIIWLAHQWPFRCTDSSRTMMAGVDPSLHAA